MPDLPRYLPDFLRDTLRRLDAGPEAADPQIALDRSLILMICKLEIMIRLLAEHVGIDVDEMLSSYEESLLWRPDSDDDITD